MAFYGRANELERLRDVFLADASRTVGIEGRPGIGKTALLNAATEAAVARGATVWQVDLAGVPKGPSLIADIARALCQWTAAATTKSPVDALADTISASAIVLAADHAESALDDAELAELREKCPRLTVAIASSRRGLGRFDEIVVLDSLPTPAAGASLDEILENPCTRLFLAAAGWVDLPAKIDDAAIEAVAEVCRRLDGLPLAVELAAARTSILAPQVLARRLDGDAALIDLDLLEPGARHPSRGLREVLGMTRSLLTTSQDTLLIDLAAFVGPFPLTAALELSGRSLADVLDDLGALVDLHLAVPADGDDEEPVFRLLPVVRAFVREDVGPAGVTRTEADTARHAYLRRVVTMAAEALARATTNDEVHQVHILRRDIAAHARHLAAAASPFAAAFVVDATSALSMYEERSTFTEILESMVRSDAVADLDVRVRAGVWLWSSRLLALAPDGVDHAAIIAKRWHRGAALIDAAKWPELALQARMIACLNATTTGDFPMTVQSATEGRQIAQAHGFGGWNARFEVWAAGAAHQTGDVAGAVRLLQSALSRAERVGDQYAILGATMMLNTLPAHAIPQDVLVPSIENGLALSRRERERGLESVLLLALTKRELAAGHLPEAARACLQRIELDRRAGWVALAPVSLMHTVLIASAAGDTEYAARLAGVLDVDLARLMRSVGPATQQAYAAAIQRLRDRIGTARFVQIASVGGMLSSAEALGEAIVWLRHESARRPPHAPKPMPVSDRELDVLVLLASGMTNKEIASRLGVTAKTVMHHSVSIYRKLQLRGRAEATAYAYQHGLISTSSGV